MSEFDYIRILTGYKALTTKGKEFVEHVLANPPARNVGENSLLSVSGAHTNKKFRHMKDYESGGCERPYILVAIMDEQVTDIFPQPAQLHVVRHDKNGKRRPGIYVPDYLECSETFQLIECKLRSELEENAASSVDWCQETDLSWRYLPGEAVAKNMGMGFKVFCPSSHPAAYLTNLQILTRMPKEDLVSPKPKLLAHVLTHLRRRPLSVQEICSLFDTVTGAYIYQAILQNKVFGLLQHQHFDNDFVVYASNEEAEYHREALRRLAPPDNSTLGPVHQRYLRSTDKERKLTVAASANYHARRSSGLPMNSTDYRDLASMRAAKAEGAPEIAGFLRKVSDRGGDGPAINSDVKKAIIKHAKEYLDSGAPPRLSKSRADFEIYAEKNSLTVPSAETYRRVYREGLAPEVAAFLSGGKRAFHAARPMADGRTANPRLAIPGLYAHIDGVYGDVFSEKDEDDLFLRPIFYPLICDLTGRVLGRGVKVGRPSRMAVLMAHRDCYLRHGFLPATIHHDWGSEFVNHAVPELAAHFGLSYQRRPAGAPRFGGLGESFNAQLSAYLQSLAGGTYFDKAGRSADARKKGRATADLSTEAIIRQADRWMYSVWNKTPIGDATESPDDSFETLTRAFPDGVAKVQDCALSRYYTSMPLDVKKIDYVRGFRFGGVRYYSDELPALLARGEQPKLPRLDCLDPSLIHVLTEKGPTTLYDLETERTAGMDEALRIEGIRELLAYSSTAKSNQHDRNVKEARLRREGQKVKAAAVGDSETTTPKPAPRAATGPDFTTVDRSSRRSLERLQSKKEKVGEA